MNRTGNNRCHNARQENTSSGKDKMMNPHILSNYPTPIASRYYAMDRKAAALRPEFKIALDLLIDIVEIYLQTLTFVSLAELSKLDNKSSVGIGEIIHTLRSSALSTGHWLSMLKLCASNFSSRSNPTIGLFGENISRLMGVDTDLLDEVNQWPSLRNDTKHDYTKDEPAAKALFQEYRPRLERLLTQSHFLAEVTLFSISDTLQGEIDNIYEIRSFYGLDPDRNVSLIATGPEIKFSNGVIFVARRTLIDSNQIRAINEFISLDPWILPPRQDSGLIYFNSCKRKKILYQNTAVDSPGRWDDADKYKAVNTFLEKLEARFPKIVENEIEEEWITALKMISLVIIPIRQRPSNPISFFHGQPISINELSADWDVRRVLYSNGNPLEYAQFFSTKIMTTLMDSKTLMSIPVIALLGPGGAGKTTVLWRICFDLAKATKIATFRILPAVSIDIVLAVTEIKLAMTHLALTTVALFIDEAASIANDIGNLIKELRYQRIPTVIFLAEQLNHLEFFKFELDIFELRTLTDAEVDELLKKLAAAGCLGYLEKLDPAERKSFFLEYSNKEILVALRESMAGGKRFDQIVYEEFKNIPDPKGQELYRIAALYHACGCFYPLEASRVYLGTTLGRDAWRSVRASCRGVVVEEPFAGGFRGMRGRHRVISSILVNKLYPTGDENSEFFEDLDASFQAILSTATSLAGKDSTSIVKQITTSEVIHDRLRNISDIDSFCFSICRFESTANGTPNFFFLGVIAKLVDTNNIDLAISLLQAACRGKTSATPASVWERLTRLLLKRKFEGDLDLAIDAAVQAMDYRQDTDEFNQSVGLLSKALMARNNKGDLDQAIDILKKYLLMNSDLSDLDQLAVQLSFYLEKRSMEGDVSCAIEVLRSLLKNRFNISENNHVIEVRLSQIFENRGAINDLDIAIELLLEYFKKWVHTDLSVLAIRLSTLLEKRKKEGDIDLAISILEKVRSSESTANFCAVTVRLSNVLENRANENDLDRAILILNEAFERTDTQNDSSVVVRLIDCLILRGTESDVCRAIETGEVAMHRNLRSNHDGGILLRIGRIRMKRNKFEDLSVTKTMLEREIERQNNSEDHKSSLHQLLLEVNSKIKKLAKFNATKDS